MKTYDKFIKYYDTIVRGINSPLEDEVEFLVEDCIREYFPTAKNILELACGTGVVGKELQKKSFQVTGVDISEKMLIQAEENIGKENTVLGDMKNISLGKTFDIVLCNYNSICHLLEFSDWEETFQNAYNHLEVGGLFVFDINTLFEFEEITRDFAQFYTFGEDVVCLEMFKKENYFEWLIKIFEQQSAENFFLTKEVVKENSFEIPKIQASLENIGFEVVEKIDFHYGEVTDKSERVYFICKKT